MLIHYAMSDFMLFHGYEISNAGILRNTPEGTNLPAKDELDSLVKRQRDIAETYRAKGRGLFELLSPTYSPNTTPIKKAECTQIATQAITRDGIYKKTI
jgi:hypothetical protein